MDLWRGGSPSEAVATARQALLLQPEQSQSLQVIQKALTQGAMPQEEGLAILRDQAQRPSVVPEARILYATALTQVGLATQAESLWADLCRGWPDNPHYLMAWIDVLIHAGKKAKARELLGTLAGQKLPTSMHAALWRRAAD